MTTRKKKDSAIASRTLLDFIEAPARLVIETPEQMKDKGLPEKGWIEVIDGEDSLEFSALQIEIMNKLGDNVQVSVQDDLELTSKLTAALIVDWDEAYFGPYSRDAVLKVLRTPRFFYVNMVVNKHRQERQDFFNKA